MTFATNKDLLDYQADIFEHGVDSWTTELASAEYDVLRKIETDWWNVERNYSRRVNYIGLGGTFDAAKLTDTQWRRATVYRALSAYILPKLSTWRPEGDSFRELISHYQTRYNEEFSAELAKGVKYDTNNDNQIDEGEKVQTQQNRLFI
jgi:hypothetical protein